MSMREGRGTQASHGAEPEDIIAMLQSRDVPRSVLAINDSHIRARNRREVHSKQGPALKRGIPSVPGVGGLRGTTWNPGAPKVSWREGRPGMRLVVVLLAYLAMATVLDVAFTNDQMLVLITVGVYACFLDVLEITALIRRNR